MRLLLIAALLPLAACHSKAERHDAIVGGTTEPGKPVAASGSGGTRQFAASGFTGIDLAGSDDVDVKQGAGFSVTAEGNPQVLDRLDIRVDGDTLRIGRKPGMPQLAADRGAVIHVVMPKLTSAAVAGSGDLTADKGEGDFKGSLGGSGNLRIAALSAATAELSVAGSGDLSVAGTASKLSASVGGSGNIRAAGLTASSADVSIAGSGQVEAVVKGPADVSLVGSGNAVLTGGAKCSVSAIGSGEARCS
jgi:hypothetical protein